MQKLLRNLYFKEKPYDEDTQFHLKRELGDIIWYWVNSCRALDLDPNEVIKENVLKLESRYTGGKFDKYYSENETRRLMMKKLLAIITVLRCQWM